MLTKKLVTTAAVTVSALALGLGCAQAKDKITFAVPSFLSGGAAGPFGVPARNGAELVINAANAGQLPAPYNTKGFAGAMAEPIFVDESGGSTKQVAEYRNLVQKRNVDAVIGYISSGSCVALAPVVEELKRLTIFTVCGTPRIFEDGDRTYIFRTMSHATADNVAAAHYIKKQMPDVKGYTGINQNYAWGQDSWRDFDLSMNVLMSGAKASDKLQFPKIFAGQYGTEISAMSLDKSDLVHSSFWGGDLEAFIFQGVARGLFKQKKVVLTVGGTAAYRLGKKMPEGLILGARGPYGVLVKDRKTPLNEWFINAYKDRYAAYPSGPAYQYAQGILAAKIAYDNAAKKAGAFPTQDQVMAELTGLEFDSFSTKVSMSMNKGHQAVTESAYGLSHYDDASGEAAAKNVEFFPASCVMPPDGVSSVDWIKGGMKGAKC